jgi:hypothetical protein
MAPYYPATCSVVGDEDCANDSILGSFSLSYSGISFHELMRLCDFFRYKKYSPIQSHPRPKSIKFKENPHPRYNNFRLKCRGVIWKAYPGRKC